MKAWAKEEQRVAEAVNGSLVAGSGSSPMGGRGDVRTPRYHVEVKLTESKRFRITKKLLDKTEMRAIKEGKDPAICVNVRGKRWVAVVYWKGWAVFKNVNLNIFKANAKKEGVVLKETKSLSGGPWVLVPFGVFETIAKKRDDDK